MKIPYFKFIVLTDDIRLQNNIRSKERLDCILYSDEIDYSGLTSFQNQKRQLVLYKTPSRAIVDSNPKRRAEWTLTNNNLNLSSIFIEDLEFPQFGYGCPNGKRVLSNGKENPLYPYKGDGYLFVLNTDYTELEILIIPEGKNYISTYYQKLLDGDFDSKLSELRKNSKPFYNYLGLHL